MKTRPGLAYLNFLFSTHHHRHTFKEIGHPRPLFVNFCLLKQTLQIVEQLNVKNVHPVNGARLRTHVLQNMSLLP